MINENILTIAKEKANQQKLCKYKIVALGFNSKGDFIGSAMNKPFLPKYHGGIHAEMELLSKYKNIRSILLIRVNKSGEFLPIDPCENCQKVLKKKE